MNTAGERVAAYVDGELDAAARAAFEAELAADAALREAVQRERALRAALADAYAPVLDEPVPPALQAALQPAAPLVDLAAVRAARAARAAPRAWRAPQWGALAACLVLGAGLGLWAGPRLGLSVDPAGWIATAPGGALVARGRLDRALDEALAADAPVGGLAVGVSIATRDGRYCRSFVLDGAAPTAGLACRRDGVWQLQALAPAEAAAGGAYRPAASALPPALLQQLDALRDGDALDAAGERAARARGWRR